MMYTHWLKGRKTNHVVWGGEKFNTLCGLKLKAENDIRFLPYVIFKSDGNFCKKCVRIYNEGLNGRFNDD